MEMRDTSHIITNDWTNYTYHHDHLNSVTAMTGHAGSIEKTFREMRNVESCGTLLVMLLIVEIEK